MAAPAAAPAEALSLDCTVCAHPFHHTVRERRPHILPCGHSFCRECLEQLLRRGQIKCPLCSRVTPVTSVEADVKQNYSLVEFLEFVEQHPLLNKRAAPPSEQCVSCEQPAVWYCVDDEAALCDEHKQQTHTLPKQQRHRICPITDKLKQQHLLPPQCAKHHSPMIFWCDKCKNICCSTCASHGVHKGHVSHLIEDIVQGFRDVLLEEMALGEATQPHLAAEAARLLDLERGLQENLRMGVAQVESAAQQLIDRILRSKQELTQQLEIQVQAARKNADLRMVTVGLCRSQVSVALEKGQACLQLSDHELLQHHAQVSKDHAAAREMIRQYEREAPLVAGFTVQGLATSDVAALERVRFVEQRAGGCQMRLPAPLGGEASGSGGAGVLHPKGRYLSQWGSVGSGDGQFYDPSCICVSNGRVYVADRRNNRVQVFDEQGRYLSQWGSEGSGDGQFFDSSGICVSNGRAYVADGRNNRVQVFDEQGRYLSQWGSEGSGDGQFGYPSCICVSNGRVYVADGRNHRVQVFDEQGRYLSQWGSVGSGDGQFGYPSCICVSNGRAYVADGRNNRVQVFDEQGRYLSQWGSVGSGDGQFLDSSGICVSNGRVYVADAINNRVQVFDEQGRYLSQWRSEGSGDGQFGYPSCICVSNGRAYVADFRNHRVQVFA